MIDMQRLDSRMICPWLRARAVLALASLALAGCGLGTEPEIDFSPPTGDVIGEVRLPDGSPASGVSVEAWQRPPGALFQNFPPDFEKLESTTTDASGRFSFDDLPTRTTSIRAQPPEDHFFVELPNVIVREGLTGEVTLDLERWEQTLEASAEIVRRDDTDVLRVRFEVRNQGDDPVDLVAESPARSWFRIRSEGRNIGVRFTPDLLGATPDAVFPISVGGFRRASAEVVIDRSDAPGPGALVPGVYVVTTSVPIRLPGNDTRRTIIRNLVATETIVIE